MLQSIRWRKIAALCIRKNIQITRHGEAMLGFHKQNCHVKMEMHTENCHPHYLPEIRFTPGAQKDFSVFLQDKSIENRVNHNRSKGMQLNHVRKMHKQI